MLQFKMHMQATTAKMDWEFQGVPQSVWHGEPAMALDGSEYMFMGTFAGSLPTSLLDNQFLLAHEKERKLKEAQYCALKAEVALEKVAEREKHSLS
ncbi:hypothetical protein ACH5RR_026351 [Cinchona calisaya]|uniref:Uncharacterized protein n=1 Tax=Cinchona calisaya TaxID=153742 RepID=A0ABD2Z3G1_9GENT